jgi:hypothetical protein
MAPGVTRELIGKRDRQHVTMQPHLGGFDPDGDRGDCQGSKTTQVGGSSPRSLTYIMLRLLDNDLKNDFQSAPPERPQ